MALGGSNKLISAQETAELLGVHRETLYAKWREWGLEGMYVGERLKFRVRDVESFIERRQHVA